MRWIEQVTCFPPTSFPPLWHLPLSLRLRPSVNKGSSATGPAAKVPTAFEQTMSNICCLSPNLHGLYKRRRVPRNNSCQIYMCLHVVVRRAMVQDRCTSQPVRHPYCSLHNMSSARLRSLLTRHCPSPTTHRDIYLEDIFQLGNLQCTRFIPQRLLWRFVQAAFAHLYLLFAILTRRCQGLWTSVS